MRLKGQFTQEDPIGLAGGLNLYGFAGGDPVSYSDPFGLLPIPLLIAGAIALFEAASTAYDVYQAGKTISNRKASGRDKVLAGGGAMLGLWTPGPGTLYAKGGRLALNAADSWGNARTLSRHFRDHGADFGAKSADEYASMASDFLQNAQRQGLPTKIDADGVIRVYDPATNTFGAYNADGTTRTFFKPTSKSYWDRQPGTEH